MKKLKELLKEFRDFALKTNTLSLAIGVIIANAAGKMVTALVESVLVPIIGMFLGGVDVSKLSFTFGDTSIGYGAFLQTTIDFFTTALCIFLVMKALTTFSKKTEEPEKPKEPDTNAYLKEIRDLLAEKK